MTSEHGIKKIVVEDDLRVDWVSGGSSHFSFMWLRDNARDPRSFNIRTHQRLVFTADLDPAIRPISNKLDDEGVLLRWPGKDTEVLYRSSFLYQYRSNQPARSCEVPTWADDFNAPRIEFSSLEKSDTELLESIWRCGVSVITGCPKELSSVEILAEKFGYVRRTIFGGVWSFEADGAMDDSAYSAESLRPHTDGTYSFDPPGVQILLCLEKEGEGAESIFVDGFHVAEKLRVAEPEVFDDLCQIPITGIYKGDGVVLRAEHPVFRVREGRVCQVCFNNYDRDVMTFSGERLERAYRGIRAVDNLFNELGNQWRYILLPGEAIVFDNWRVLHGRTKYKGKRKIVGAYINREDLESRFISRDIYA